MHTPADATAAQSLNYCAQTDALSETAQPEPLHESRVGYVLKMYPRFSETFIVSEILAREAAGEQVVIFSLRPTTDVRFHAELARVQAPVIHIPRPSSASRLWKQLSDAAAGPQLASGLTRALPELARYDHDDAYQAVAVAQLAAEHGVTHLHAHFASVATSVARLAGMIAGLPYSFTAHAKDIFHEDVDAAELEQKLAEAHHAITISGYNMEHLRRTFPAASSRLHLVHNGLELARFPYEPARMTPADNTASIATPRLLSVGRLVEKKGFHLLIEAVAILRERGIAVQADIAGDGPLADALQEQIDELGVGDAVQLLGARTQHEITRMLGSHDVFVAPFVIGADGNADGLPTVLLEAMARGIPCVAADVTAVGEVIRSGETGWLIPSGDVSAVADAIAEAISVSDTQRCRLTDAARQQVERLFDSRRQAAILRRLISQPAAEPSSSSRAAEAVPAGVREPEGALV
uniref:glycosyltransferase family 4 protein n=2 Tax=Nesterenkonia massiliensis TaxID=1232429 RepID=UPI00041B2905|nr:glycosyltransferase family 4 protein [Nesterenkonia massiliensis]